MTVVYLSLKHVPWLILDTSKSFLGFTMLFCGSKNFLGLQWRKWGKEFFWGFFVEFNALPFVLITKDFHMDKQTVSPRTDRQSGRALCPVLATTTVACFRAQVVLKKKTVHFFGGHTWEVHLFLPTWGKTTDAGFFESSSHCLISDLYLCFDYTEATLQT